MAKEISTCVHVLTRTATQFLLKPETGQVSFFKARKKQFSPSFKF